MEKMYLILIMFGVVLGMGELIASDAGKMVKWKSEKAFQITEPDLIPEGMAYDPVTKAFYISSLAECKVVKVDKNGKVTDFTSSRQDGLFAVVGMQVDTERRHLWVCHGFGYPNISIPKEFFGSTGVYKYDLDTGKLLKKYMLSGEEKHFLNDITLTQDGIAYISDSFVSGVYKIDSQEDVLKRFVELKDHRYPNGIAYSPDTDKIFVSTSDDLVAVDAKTGKAMVIAYPENIKAAGNDGLYYYNHGLVGIQNIINKGRIVFIQLDDKQQQILKMDILEPGNPINGISTTGAIVDGYLYYLGNTQIDKFDDQGKLPPEDKLEDVVVLKLKLPNRL
jgi:DNA-binding beta-propeller fold protein YncE